MKTDVRKVQTIVCRDVPNTNGTYKNVNIAFSSQIYLFRSSLQMLKLCVLSPATLEVLLNSYTFVPSCEWMDSLSAEIYEVSSLRDKLTPSVVSHPAVTVSPSLSQDHRAFFDLVRQRSGQPRSLQHLCRWALRQYLGARCYSAVSKLDIPGSVKDYLLLCNDGTLQ